MGNDQFVKCALHLSASPRACSNHECDRATETGREPHRHPQNLIAIRKTSGLTKVDFALQLGISRVLLDLIESGNSNLKLSTLEQIAERLGVQPWELIR